MTKNVKNAIGINLEKKGARNEDRSSMLGYSRSDNASLIYVVKDTGTIS
ncbi:hypothetical protein NUZ5A_20107 [Candidatus Nitrosotenuis uzonensis]|uniref:Uncharacterized protein n=1 Tax=Candidatus Nitrosotenuis uzonensis TaxID=1407055 RepID=A0A812F3P9_9ARCH|nr:hypothetical protein NUZ5A_20107 [Candidatus Nitrosotenuis uzonensis]